MEKLQFQPLSSCGPVEVALPGLVFDLSSLVLYGAQAIPVRLKILLDRLYSILTPEQVGHILHTLGWSLGDYVRGYKLQYPSGKVLDRWLMVTPEEELLILKQFLRFGETRPIVELMTLQCLAANPDLNLRFKTTKGQSGSTTDVFCYKKKGPADHNNAIHHFEDSPGGLSLLLPFHFQNSTFHLPTKDLVPPCKVSSLPRSSHAKWVERNQQEGGREGSQNSQEDSAVTIKADPDRPNLSQSVRHQKPWFHHEQDLHLHRNISSLSPPFNPSLISVSPPLTSSPLNNPQRLQRSSSHSPSPLPSFTSSFFSALPTTSFSSSLCPLPSAPSSLHPLPSSLCTLPSLSPAGGRKGRVCCGVCGKSFYDKGTLKIHYNAVHLKIKHRCTVAGCTMVFSSLRSRNRHSANPNPRLHTGIIRDVHANRNPNAGPHSEVLIHKNVRKNTQTQLYREKEIQNALWQQDEDAHTLLHIHTLKNGLNHQTHPQQDCWETTPPQADSPPSVPQPLSKTLKPNTDQNFTCKFDLQTEAPPPPPVFPVQSTSSPDSPPSLIHVVSQAPEKPNCYSSLQPNHKLLSSLPDTTSVSFSSYTSQPCEDGGPEQKQGKACTGPLTNQQQRWDTCDPLPKKKSRKSSMPVKIAREKMENKDQEGY
ncbi:zinc finger protein basonuclin-2-like [Xyrichtys novacula]|nr:zinc finger protein basonuclin-2-like [Xyrichtys novacula]